MLISPYFREKEIRNVFPMYHMSDYKVNYSNHKQFQAGMITFLMNTSSSVFGDGLKRGEICPWANLFLVLARPDVSS